MKNTTGFDSLFQQAVIAVDKGDEYKLKELLDAHPELATERLYEPGEWLTKVIGDALNNFFKDPYLLWFVSEDAVRNKTLPSRDKSPCAERYGRRTCIDRINVDLARLLRHRTTAHRHSNDERRLAPLRPESKPFPSHPVPARRELNSPDFCYLC